LFSILLFYLNLIYPYYPGDDLIFQMKIPQDGIIGHERISSFGELLESQYNFYNNYHYRVPTHFLLQAILMAPYWLFDLCNVIVFLLLPICLLDILPKRSSYDYWVKYYVLLLFLWCFHINLGWAYFPATGALNYTWWLVPQILFVSQLFRILDRQRVNQKLFLGLAIVNSFGNENACLALLFLTMAVLWIRREEKGKLLFLTATIMCLGGIIMLLSPSIGKRLQVDGHMTDMAAHLLEYAKRTAYHCMTYLPLSLLLLVNRKFDWVADQKKLLLICAFLVATLSMVLAPIFEARSAVFGFFLLLLILLLIKKESWSWLSLIVMTLVAIVFSVQRVPQFKEQYSRFLTNDKILTSNQGLQDTIELKKYCDYTIRHYLLCHEVSESIKTFDNRSVAAFYNIKAVRLSNEYIKTYRRDSIYNAIEKGSYDLSYCNSHIDMAVCNQKEGSHTELVIQSSSTKKPYYIIRGNRKGNIFHSLIRILPWSLQLAFLDFLEPNFLDYQDHASYNGINSNYYYIENTDNYNYLLISRYNHDTHSPEGEVIEIHL